MRGAPLLAVPEAALLQVPAPLGATAGARSVVQRAGLKRLDALLPAALLLWWVGVRAVDPAAMNDYGLLPALPVVFFLGLALLVGSTVALLLRPELPAVRLGLHLVALILMLHGTLPSVLSQPIYPWVYKHVGVVGHINLHGSVDSGIDIYQNWPGFFAVAAWLTRVAGVASPLVYAAWAPVYFNLLTVLELGFVFRSLPVTRRARWLALFLFVAGNWIGQDYFAPQALAFVLSLAVFGIALAWLQADRPSLVIRVVRSVGAWAGRFHGASAGAGDEPDGEPRPPAPSRFVSVGALFLTFATIVVVHQLSPYVVLLGLGLLAAAGLLRPRWAIAGLAAVAIVYLVLHFAYVERTQDLFASLGDPFRNLHNTHPDDSVVLTGRRVTALAAPAVIACLWLLAGLGGLRRLWGRRPTLVVALLAFSPVLIALGQSYGGEAVFRIYLFSLPWIALLGASALDPRSRRHRLWTALAMGAVLAATVAMFLSASFGAAELYAVRPGEVQASRYFYDHAEPKSVLTLVTPSFPTRVGDRYSEFTSAGDNPRDLLTTATQLKHRQLGAAELPDIAQFVEQQEVGPGGSRYLVLSTGQQVYAEVLGQLPPGSMASLDQALAGSPEWKAFYRNSDAVIYRLARGATGIPNPGRAEPDAGRPAPRPSRDRSIDLAGLGAGLVGLLLLGAAVGRRRGRAIQPVADLLADEVMTQASVERHLRALGVALADPDAGVRARGLELVPGAALGRALAQVLGGAEDVDARVRAVAHRRLAEGPSWLWWMALGRCSQRDELLVVLAEEDAARLAGVVVERLGSPEIADRVQAVEVAGRLGSPGLLAEVARVLGADPDAPVRVAAGRVLVGVGGEVVLSAFVERLADPALEVRAVAVEALVGCRSAGLAGCLAGSLTAANTDSVGAALVGMGAVGEEALADVVVEGPAERAAVAAQLLAATGTATTRVLADLGSVDPGRRLRAVDLLGAIDGPHALDALVDALGDARSVVRGRAARQLGHIADGAGRQALDHVARCDRSAEVVAAAEEALRAMDGRALATSGAGLGS